MNPSAWRGVGRLLSDLAKCMQINSQHLPQPQIKTLIPSLGTCPTCQIDAMGCQRMIKLSKMQGSCSASCPHGAACSPLLHFFAEQNPLVDISPTLGHTTGGVSQLTHGQHVVYWVKPRSLSTELLSSRAAPGMY